MKAEMTTECTASGDNCFNDENGHILFRATNIAGFGRTHVSWVHFFFMLLCCALRLVTPVLYRINLKNMMVGPTSYGVVLKGDVVVN